MARRVTIQSYPLLKITIPVAILAAVIGLYLFLTHSAPCANAADCTLGTDFKDHPTSILLPWMAGAIVLAFAGLLYRKKETVNVLLPSDTLAEHSRQDLQKLLAGLDEAKAKGELTEERYIKARDRVLSQMKKQPSNPGSGAHNFFWSGR